MRPPMPFPDAITTFQRRQLPCEAVPAGYAALVAACGLSAALLPYTLFAIGTRHRIINWECWRLMTPRHAPAPTLEGHLTFALKYEGLNLAALKALFDLLDPAVIEAIVRARPTGRYVRRIWFLYEWLAGRQLDLPPLNRASYVDALDPALQYPGHAVNSPRHRVRNNLPGTPVFCPLVFRTEELERFAATDLRALARTQLEGVPNDHSEFLARVLCNGELRPNGGTPATLAMMEQWMRGITGGGASTFTLNELSAVSGIPVDELTARIPAIETLVHGINDFAERTALFIEPPLAAACMAFGYARACAMSDPYEQGHRYVAQKHLARCGYRYGPFVLPVSMIAHQHRLAEYQRLLERGDAGLFDATPHAEFFFHCLKDTIEIVLPGARHFVSERISAGAAAAE